MNPAVVGAAALVGYAALVQALRWRRARHIDSIEDSQELAKAMGWLEYPVLNRLALEFALFRTYAIPSISALLQKTGEFSTSAAKRYDDTDLLVSEIIWHTPGHPRRETALQRLNQIHGLYTISHDDFLYVLTTFIVEPVRFAQRYGLRKFTTRELDATVSLWNGMGSGMDLDTSIFTDYTAVERFHDDYEAQHMKFAASNVVIAEATMQLFLAKLPPILHGVGKTCIAAIMDDRLREAFAMKRPPFWLGPLLHSILALRGLLCILFVPPITKHLVRVPEHVCPVTQRFKYNFAVYEDTYPDGYKIEELGPSKGWRRNSDNDSGSNTKQYSGQGNEGGYGGPVLAYATTTTTTSVGCLRMYKSEGRRCGSSRRRVVCLNPPPRRPCRGYVASSFKLLNRSGGGLMRVRGCHSGLIGLM